MSLYINVLKSVAYIPTRLRPLREPRASMTSLPNAAGL